MHEEGNDNMSQRSSRRPGGMASLIGGALLLALVGCEGGSAPPADDDAAASASAPATSAPAEADAPASSAAAVLTDAVSMATTTELTPARRLKIAGRTNLPDRARLLVELERRASGVSWQSRTEVRDGAFTAGPLGPGSGLLAGDYVIRISMPPADVQPPAVKARIGARGEHLTGALVARSPHGLGNIIEYRRDYLFDR